MASINRYLDNILRILLLSIAITYILNPFLNGRFDFLLFIFGVAILLLGMLTMKKGYLTPVIVFLIAGLALIVAYKQPISTLVDGTSSMMNLVSILVAFQLFPVPVKVGNYGPAVETLIAQYAKKEKHLFLIVALFSCIFGSFLLLGVIPFMIALLGMTIANNVQDKKRFTSTSISRSYIASLFWSPGSVVMLLTLQVTDIKWTQIFPYGVLLCLLCLLSSYFLESRFVLHDRPVKNIIEKKSIEEMDKKKAWNQILQIVLVVIGIATGIYLFDFIPILSATHCVVLAEVTIFLLWMFALRRNSGKSAAMSDYWQDGILKSKDLASMFVAIGIFAEAVKGSEIIGYVRPFLAVAVSHEYLFLAVLPAVIIILSIFGIHCFISIAVVGSLLASVTLPFSMVPVAVAILAGSTIGFVLSPFSGSSLTMANYLKSNSFEVAIRWNGIYCICMYIESVFLIWVIAFL
jgi:hypothetical protein